MDKTTLTPEESLLLITKTIEETKQRFKENGHIIILWGAITFTVFLSQYILVVVGLYKVFDIIWTDYFISAWGDLYIYICKEKCKKRKSTQNYHVKDNTNNGMGIRCESDDIRFCFQTAAWHSYRSNLFNSPCFVYNYCWINHQI